MQTFWRRFEKEGRKTFIACCITLGFGMATSCTSSRDNPALESAEPVRVYRPTPSPRDMGEQASTINRKHNIEANLNDPSNKPPTVRTQEILPGRQRVGVDTFSTRPARRPDTTRVKKKKAPKF